MSSVESQPTNLNAHMELEQIYWHFFLSSRNSTLPALLPKPRSQMRNLRHFNSGLRANMEDHAIGATELGRKRWTVYTRHQVERCLALYFLYWRLRSRAITAMKSLSGLRFPSESLLIKQLDPFSLETITQLNFPKLQWPPALASCN
jgi:hypothetical protein